MCLLKPPRPAHNFAEGARLVHRTNGRRRGMPATYDLAEAGRARL